MTTTKQLALALGALILMLIVSFLIVDRSSQWRSVEFGLVETSPRGVAGGYAMPASGASDPSGLRYSCAPSGTSVYLNWNASTDQSAVPNSTKTAKSDRRTGLLNFFMAPQAHAGGGDGGGGGGGDNGGGNNEAPSPLDPARTPSHNHQIPAPVSYEVQISGLGTFTTNSTSYSASINPGTTYSWSVRACAGGACSEWQSGSNFTCYAPPTLSLTADSYAVPYNTGTTLRWSSQNTTSCTASGAWAGGRSVSGSEATGPLRQTTYYLMQCVGPRGQTAPSSATIGVIYGTGAVIDPCKKIVNKDEDFCIKYDVGTSNPAYCVISAGVKTIYGPLSAKSGSVSWAIDGETIFTLNCEEGGNIDTATVKVLPEFQET